MPDVRLPPVCLDVRRKLFQIFVWGIKDASQLKGTVKAIFIEGECSQNFLWG